MTTSPQDPVATTPASAGVNAYRAQVLDGRSPLPVGVTRQTYSILQLDARAASRAVSLAALESLQPLADLLGCSSAALDLLTRFESELRQLLEAQPPALCNENAAEVQA